MIFHHLQSDTARVYGHFKYMLYLNSNFMFSLFEPLLVTVNALREAEKPANTDVISIAPGHQ